MIRAGIIQPSYLLVSDDLKKSLLYFDEFQVSSPDIENAISFYQTYVGKQNPNLVKEKIDSLYSDLDYLKSNKVLKECTNALDDPNIFEVYGDFSDAYQDSNLLIRYTKLLREIDILYNYLEAEYPKISKEGKEKFSLWLKKLLRLKE